MIARDGPKLKSSAVIEADPDDDDPLAVQATAARATIDDNGCPLLSLSRRAAIGRNACTTFVKWSMSEFARLTLAMAIGNETGKRGWAHVIEETGLTGRFDFTLNYDVSYHMMINSPMPENIRASLNSKNPVSIFKAVEAQLGLRLVPARAKLPVLVIQEAERTPVEN